MLRRLQNNVESYTPEEWKHTTKERLQWLYETAKQVSETLRTSEVLLLYYLRNSGGGNTYRFRMIAKKLYDANRELETIKSAKSSEKRRVKSEK